MKQIVTMAQIRREVYAAWQTICHNKRALHVPRTWKLSKAERERLPYTNQEFLAEIRQYGDLRQRSTWLKAAPRLIAHQWVIYGYADPVRFIAFYAYPSGVAGLVAEEFKAEMETHKDFLKLAKVGLEQLLGQDYCRRDEPGLELIYEWAENQLANGATHDPHSVGGKSLTLPLGRLQEQVLTVAV